MEESISTKVSVLMPVFNADEFLREAIDSILDQTFSDFEFIIINDGSTDTSEKIIESYRDSRIRYVKNERNFGLVYTLNRGIDLAKGTYIARMDADDRSLPTRFEKQVAYLDQHSEVGACGTAFRFFGDKTHLSSNPSDFRQAFTMLSVNSSLGHPTSMIRRSVLKQHSIYYEEEFQYAADYAFWVRIGQVSQLTSLPECLLLYRWHATNMSNSDPTRSLARGNARILWFELFLERPLTAPEKKYLVGDTTDWSTFRAGKNLFISALESKKSSLLAKNYFGELVYTEWEFNLIDRFGLAGLLGCLFQFSIRKRSRATTIGLIAHYLSTYGIKI